jgi:hypothetical protein
MSLFVIHPTAELERELVDRRRDIDAEDIHLMSHEIQKKDDGDVNDYHTRYQQYANNLFGNRAWAPERSVPRVRNVDGGGRPSFWTVLGLTIWDGGHAVAEVL